MCSVLIITQIIALCVQDYWQVHCKSQSVPSHSWKESVGTFAVTAIKAFCKATASQTSGSLSRVWETAQRNRTVNQEIALYRTSCLLFFCFCFYPGAKCEGSKGTVFSQIVIRYLTMWKTEIKLDVYFLPCQTVNSRWVRDLNVKQVLLRQCRSFMTSRFWKIP